METANLGQDGPSPAFRLEVMAVLPRPFRWTGIETV